ncbi:MAG: outer membrane protein assembly factor BamA [Proteobacteria bacterium]|nr:MAG: outer membrane protein assembly factor BamA [Pseudomonadota bacterium]
MFRLQLVFEAFFKPLLRFSGIKQLDAFSCLLVLQAIFVVGPTRAESFDINAVQIMGSQRVDPAAIRLQLQKTSGQIERDIISQDVKTLYKTGFFDQVSASIVEEGGKTFLRYEVVEKPSVRKAYIKGNKEVSDDDLGEIFVFDSQRFLDRARIDGLIRQATALYQSRGFYDASFDYSIVPVGDNQVDLTFTVTEGERYKIGEIEIRGLKNLDEDDVKSVMQTTTYKWWSSWLLGTGRLSSEMLDSDKALIRQYFLDHGYIDATLTDPEIRKEEGRLVLVFEANEGELFKIGQVTASGDLLDGDQAKTLEGVELASGDTFSAQKVREATFKVSDKFTDIGYAFANVVPGTSIDRADKQVNLNFEVAKGNLVSVNRINIEGNYKTYDNVIRREIRVDEQEVYNGTKIKRSQALLQRLGYFEEVNISSEPVADDKVDLNVNVREGSTGTFSAGAGYSTSDGVLFNTRLSENNLFGTGRSASINVDFGDERDGYILSFDDRRINDSYFAGGIDLLHTNREFSDFDRQLSGAAFTVGYPLEEVWGERFEDIAASIKYEYLNIDISNVDEDDAAQLVIDSEGTSSASGFTPKLVRNTINNPLNPTDGSRQELSVEMTGLGGNEEFYLLEAKNTIYYPLIKRESGDLVFGWRTTVGYGETYDGDDFPLYRRYFPGGINSVRGYKNRSLGPKDEEGNEYGGSKELVNNFELIFPIINSAGIRGVVFYDAGQAFDDEESIDIGDLRLAYGAGIRWQSPLGPLRIEFGFPIDREEGEDSMVTLFSFGAPL